jgi:hypothetical protein
MIVIQHSFFKIFLTNFHYRNFFSHSLHFLKLCKHTKLQLFIFFSLPFLLLQKSSSLFYFILFYIFILKSQRYTVHKSMFCKLQHSFLLSYFKQDKSKHFTLVCEYTTYQQFMMLKKPIVSHDSKVVMKL